MRTSWRLGSLCWVWVSLAALGCETKEPEPSNSFYDRKIAPILAQTCANSPTQSGCHVAADNRGNAFGNLNLESYDQLIKRSDLLIEYGPYGMPALLLKAVPDYQIRLTNWEQTDPIVITTDIPHAGGRDLLDVTSSSFTQIQRWIDRGATENNTVRPEEVVRKTRCSDAPGVDPAFDPNVDPATDDYETFRNRVNPIITERCSAGNCHGFGSNSLYLTCGNTPEQVRWNYFAAGDYVSTQADSSEILRRPLGQASGGTYHEGGSQFTSPSDNGYQALLEWAEEKGGPTNVPSERGFTFFHQRVQPMLVKKGCMIIGCHSPAMGHDYRLRGGSGGHFGLPATRRNYELSLEQIAPDSPDPDSSRLIRKNLVPRVDDAPPGPLETSGITHRGGALLGVGMPDCADEPDAPNGCCDMEAARSSPDLDAQPSYCVIRAWIELEREERAPSLAPLSSIVYVSRPASAAADVPQDFGMYQPGADLMQATATLEADGAITVGAGTSLLGGCGLSAGIDVRRPAVSWDGSRIAFAARTSESEPWRVYVVDGSGCAVEPGIDAAPVDDAGDSVPSNGELVHNFDPAFAPDGSIVFASTRGNVMNTNAFSYQGPTRTPADPSRLNANLYVLEDGGVRQLTFLLNQELTPAFMSDGRLMMVTEKRTPGFYMLAGRRLNLDGGDYHPLFGQRSTIGFNQFTDVAELADKNLIAIFSEKGAAHGAGALGIVNRSIGIDQRSTNPEDYLQDPSAIDWQNPAFFQRSIHILDGNGALDGSGGVYRNPTPLPNGNILVSYAPDVQDISSFSGNFDLYVVDPIAVRRLGPVVSAAEDLVWPVAVYGRYNRGTFKSRLDEANGATTVSTKPEDREISDITILDVPLLTSLLFQNTRAGRPIAATGADVEVWESLPPESGITSYSAGGSFVTSDQFGEVYARRRLLGRAGVEADGSARIQVPGGMPIVLAPLVQLAGDGSPQRHHQREEMQFYPGEVVRQSFRRDLFDGFCGNCHGSVSGFESDLAVNPDILTSASIVDAKDSAPVRLVSGGDIQGPPFP